MQRVSGLRAAGVRCGAWERMCRCVASAPGYVCAACIALSSLTAATVRTDAFDVQVQAAAASEFPYIERNMKRKGPCVT